MRNFLLYILIPFFVYQIKSNGQTTSIARPSEIRILPGIGITFENDTVFLLNTSVERLTKLLSVNRAPWTTYRTACGYTEDGNPWSAETVIVTYTFRNIKFNYEGSDTSSLSLNEMVIVYDSLSKVIVNDKIELGTINPRIKRYFHRNRTCDYVYNDRNEPINYDFNSKGIEFELLRQGRKKVLTKVKIKKGQE